MSRALKSRVRLALLSAIMVACSDDTITEPGERLPVVRAYLYANEPVTDVRLSWTTTLDAADTIPAPINNAQVSLLRNGVRYNLTRSSGDSGYYHYAGSDLVVNVGDTFDFEAQIGDQTVTGRTQVPTRPTGARLSKSTVTIPVFTGTPGNLPDFSELETTVYWVRQPNALYFVAVESAEASPTPVDTGGLFLRVAGRFISAPTNADSFKIVAPMLKYYGRHRVRVYRVNEEYAQLYASLQQDSRDLNEPVTNIHGGLGIFSAFASDSTFFRAVRP